MIEQLNTLGVSLMGATLWLIVWTLIKIVLVVAQIGRAHV